MLPYVLLISNRQAIFIQRFKYLDNFTLIDIIYSESKLVWQQFIELGTKVGLVEIFSKENYWSVLGNQLLRLD